MRDNIRIACLAVISLVASIISTPVAAAAPAKPTTSWKPAPTPPARTTTSWKESNAIHAASIDEADMFSTSVMFFKFITDYCRFPESTVPETAEINRLLSTHTRYRTGLTYMQILGDPRATFLERLEVIGRAEKAGGVNGKLCKAIHTPPNVSVEAKRILAELKKRHLAAGHVSMESSHYAEQAAALKAEKLLRDRKDLEAREKARKAQDAAANAAKDKADPYSKAIVATRAVVLNNPLASDEVKDVVETSMEHFDSPELKKAQDELDAKNNERDEKLTDCQKDKNQAQSDMFNKSISDSYGSEPKPEPEPRTRSKAGSLLRAIEDVKETITTIVDDTKMVVNSFKPCR